MNAWVVTGESGLNGHWIVGVYTSRALAERARNNDLERMGSKPTGYCCHCITEVEINQQTGPTEGGCG
jgi:hypothetical protein